MRSILAISLLFALAVAVQSQPASSPRPRTTSISPNPTVNLIRQGLIDKLCKQKYPNLGRSTPRTSSPTPKPRRSRQIRTTEKYKGSLSRTSTTTPPSGPTCSDYNHHTFEELINMVKKTLKPVGPPRH